MGERRHIGAMVLLAMAMITTMPAGAVDDPVPAARAQRMVVTDFEIEDGIAPRTARLMADNLVVELRKLSGYSVVGMAEVRSMLAAETDRQTMGCSEGASCLAELADALGADVLITGRLGRLPGQTVLSVRRIDQAKAQVVGEVEERLVDTGGEELLAAIGPAVERLFPEVPLKVGTTRGVPKEVARRLNPPPLPVWSTVTVAGVSGAVGVVGIIAGGVSTLTLQNAQDEVDGSVGSPVSGAAIVQRQADASTQALVANVAFGVAAVGLVGAGVMALLTDWGGLGEAAP